MSKIIKLRKEGDTLSKAVKVILIIAIVLFVIIMVGGFIAGNFFYNIALSPEADRTAVFEADHNSMDFDYDDEVMEQWLKEREALDAWLETTDYNDEYITSEDGLKLHSTSILNEKESDLWMVSCHGYASNGLQMKAPAKWFYEKGYNILMPDARGHGDSEGDYIGMGWDDRRDIVNWIEKIVSENPDSQIVLYGVSMGGATVMMTSGEELPENVKAIVEDCGYSSVWGEFSYQLKALFKLPEFPLMHFSSLVTKIRAGYFLDEADAVKQVEKCVTPMLFIHGDEDTFVPFEMLDVVYDAASCDKERLVAEGAGHGQAAAILGDVYWDTVDEFIGRYITE